MSGFDLITSDRNLQDNWIKRLIAAIVDGIIVGVVFWVIIFALAFGMFFYGWGFLGLGGLLFGVLWLLYFAFMEGTRGATIGKQLLHLRVVATSGNMDVSKGFIRNLSKIHWILLLIDIVVGLATQGDPRQRFLDRYANTIVLKEGENIQYQPPAPPPQPYQQPPPYPSYPPYQQPPQYPPQP